jgi:hypothetical protein
MGGGAAVTHPAAHRVRKFSHVRGATSQCSSTLRSPCVVCSRTYPGRGRRTACMGQGSSLELMVQGLGFRV